MVLWQVGCMRQTFIPLQAVRNLKAAASNGVKFEQDTNVIHKARTASALPADFFDQQDSKKSRAGSLLTYCLCLLCVCNMLFLIAFRMEYDWNFAIEIL